MCNFFTKRRFSALFWLTRTSPGANFHIGGRVCMYATFKIRNHVRDHWFEPREGLWCVFTVKKRPSVQLLDLYGRVRMQIFSWENVYVYNLSHNFLCLGSTDMFPRSVSTTRRVHARVHTQTGVCSLFELRSHFYGVGVGVALIYLVLEHEVFREAGLRSHYKILCSDWSRPS